jgi:hypothetical protein
LAFIASWEARAVFRSLVEASIVRFVWRLAMQTRTWRGSSSSTRSEVGPPTSASTAFLAWDDTVRPSHDGDRDRRRRLGHPGIGDRPLAQPSASGREGETLAVVPDAERRFVGANRRVTVCDAARKRHERLNLVVSTPAGFIGTFGSTEVRSDRRRRRAIPTAVGVVARILVPSRDGRQGASRTDRVARYRACHQEAEPFVAPEATCADRGRVALRAHRPAGVGRL